MPRPHVSIDDARFNPRACVRRDASHGGIAGARTSCFNPRACVRRDPTVADQLAIDDMFQSTRLREARPGRFAIYTAPWLFQSTRLREARPGDGRRAKSICEFQSTRLREARRQVAGIFDDPYLFQSTRLREARHAELHAHTQRPGFQSTRLREARRGPPEFHAQRVTVSIHAPA